ncbi:type II toxin-antitoxin system death-on-curing family toxin [Microlunatus parietis]|uniref:Death-on-curing protein n=1 Tax=Microlunatus parietis TaxID=682979 RepID=A0A7Y9LAU8_9ACTN|nr:Fic family protein [Microlunatus parietis]NYE69121.1 death-on-curing protein [Microlunatus parietis]
MTYFLTLEDVTDLGIAMMAEEGEDFLIADPGLLESALARPRASAFGEPAYPNLPAQAAALMHSLARNDPLVDGNKRLAWAATKLFLLFNGITLRATSLQEGERFVLGVATGSLDLLDIGQRIANWSTPS